MSIYEKVLALCQARGVTINELEKSAGIGQGAVGKWNVHTPTIKSLQRVADYFGVKLSDLLE